MRPQARAGVRDSPLAGVRLPDGFDHPCHSWNLFRRRRRIGVLRYWPGKLESGIRQQISERLVDTEKEPFEVRLRIRGTSLWQVEPFALLTDLADRTDSRLP